MMNNENKEKSSAGGLYRGVNIPVRILDIFIGCGIAALALLLAALLFLR